MNCLDASYELSFSKINFLERKFHIKHNKTILIGPAKVGKSYLIFDYLSNFEEEDYLYIDFFDKRNDKKYIKENLDLFLRENEIITLVLENFDFSFEIPYCENIIISTQTFKEIKGYATLYITALDFEEYLLFDTKHQNPVNSFNSYLKHGKLPELINYDENKKISRLQEIISLQCENSTDFEILKILFENIHEKKSLFQLFNTLKIKMKISKDKFYLMCKTYEENRTIYFLEKYNSQRAVKKIYAYNHTFLSAISFNKKFKNEFSNMVFLELINKYEKVFYLDNIDFYVPSEDLAIIAIPFFNTFLMQNQLKKIYKTAKEYNIKEIQIVNVSNDETIKNDDFIINAQAFYEWALS